MVKIAYFTPLSPVRSGISSYSEELLPYLGQHAEVDIYIDDYQPSNHDIKTHFPIWSYHNFPQKSSDYDLFVYQMGNHAPYHEFIYQTLLEFPGLVVLHDYIYSHFYGGIMLKNGDDAEFRTIMRYCYGDKGLLETDKIIAGRADFFQYSLVHKILDSSLGAVVHSDYIKQLVEREVPSAKVTTIPMGVKVTDSLDPKSLKHLREKHGFSDKDFIIASFGRMTPNKRINVALKAFAKFKRTHPDSKYLLVGELLPESGLKSLVRSLRLEKDVIATGHVNERDFKEYLAVSDFCVALRFPTAGETSMALLKAMEAGLPASISNYAQFSEFPDDSVVKVDLGDHEETLLVEYMKLLADNDALRHQVGENARRYIHRHHNLEKAAQGYFESIKFCLREKQKTQKSEVITPLTPALEELAKASDEEYINKEADNLFKELGLRPGKINLEKRNEFRRRIQRYQYYGQRLGRYYRNLGFKTTMHFATNRFFRHYNPLGGIQSKRAKKAHPLKCDEIFHEICVLPDGRMVCSCCDFLGQHLLGNVHQSKIKDVFNDLPYRRLREALLLKTPEKMCQACGLRTKPIQKYDRPFMSHITALQIEITNACNLKCPECTLTLTKRPGQTTPNMSYETFTDIIDQVSDSLRLVKFYNYGEPFLHKDCMKMLRYIKETDPRIAVLISTNGTLIPPPRQKELVDLGINVLDFSVDGASQEIYQQYRVGGDLKTVLGNMKGIIEYRKERGAKKPFVIWQYILFKWNDSDEEIERAKKMAAEIGVDALMWVLTHTPGASRRFTLESDTLSSLVSRNGIGKSDPLLVWSLSADQPQKEWSRHTNPQWNLFSKKMKKVICS